MSIHTYNFVLHTSCTDLPPLWLGSVDPCGYRTQSLYCTAECTHCTRTLLCIMHCFCVLYVCTYICICGTLIVCFVVKGLMGGGCFAMSAALQLHTGWRCFLIKLWCSYLKKIDSSGNYNICVHTAILSNVRELKVEQSTPYGAIMLKCSQSV